MKLDVRDLGGRLDTPGRLVFHAVCANPSGGFPLVRSSGQDHVNSMCLAWS